MNELSNDQLALLTRAFLAPTVGRHQALVGVIRGELTQLRALMDDATLRLTSSFETMTSESARPIAGVGTPCCCALRERDVDAAGDMDRATADAVTALQFQDIATQLLDSIGTHVDQLDMTTASWSSPAAPRRPNDASDPRGVPPRRASVTQDTMTVGTVELF